MTEAKVRAVQVVAQEVMLKPTTVYLRAQQPNSNRSNPMAHTAPWRHCELILQLIMHKADKTLYSHTARTHYHLLPTFQASILIYHNKTQQTIFDISQTKVYTTKTNNTPFQPTMIYVYEENLF